MSNEPLVKVEQVSKKFCKDLRRSLRYGAQDLVREMRGLHHGGSDALRPGEFWAVDDISFELTRGECIGIVGRNGAGKSSLLKVLNGLIKPDQGRVTMRGRVAALIELGAGFNPLLTARENIYVNGQILGFSKKDLQRRFDSIVEFSGIGQFLDSPVRTFSSGMKVRLGFAIAAQLEPDVLIVDEVLAVGDIGFRIKCLNRIQELLKETAVVFVSHSMPYVGRICTKVLVLEDGRCGLLTTDVAKGIDRYYGGFGWGERQDHFGAVVGIGAIRINGVLDFGSVTVQYGSDVALEMEILPQHERRTLCARLVVWNQEQRAVLDVIGQDGELFSWQSDGRDSVLSVQLRGLTLTAGKHSVSVIVSDCATKEVLCRVDNACGFLMGQHLSSAAGLFFPGEWAVGPLAIGEDRTEESACAVVSA